MLIATMKSEGRITVPKDVRDALGLAPGSAVVFTLTADGDCVMSSGPHRHVPGARARWRSWTEVAGLYDGTTDVTWEQDRELIADDVSDPWLRE